MKACSWVVVLLAAFLPVVVPAVPFRSVSSKIDWRVIGGTAAPPDLYPYQVSIRHRPRNSLLSTNPEACSNLFHLQRTYVDDFHGYHSCGGSILTPEYILTAAHCISHEKPSDFQVVVGSSKLNEGGVIHAVVELHWHKNFSIWRGQNDIGVLKIAPEIIFSRHVAPIALETSKIFVDETVVLSGWGTTDASSAVSNILQHVHLKTIAIEYCDKLHTFPINENQICTSTDAGKGACKGDSGGPLVKFHETGEVRQVGIVSFGKNCERGYPDVFTKTSSFVVWINDKCGGCI